MQITPSQQSHRESGSPARISRIPPGNGVSLFLDALARSDINILIGLGDTNEHNACEMDAACLDHFEVAVSPGHGSTAPGLCRRRWQQPCIQRRLRSGSCGPLLSRVGHCGTVTA